MTETPENTQQQDTPQPTSYPVPPAPMYESEARNVSMWIHYGAAIAALLTLSTAAFLVPLIMWLIYRDRSALVDWHGKQNLNLQLTMIGVVIAGFFIGIVTFFFGFIVTLPVMIGYGIYSVVISFVAGAAAQRGEYYKIPLSIPFVK